MYIKKESYISKGRGHPRKTELAYKHTESWAVVRTAY